jgi:hypothetical protein
MAIIDKHSTLPTDEGSATMPWISQAEISNPVCSEVEDEIILYVGSEKPLLPDMPIHNLPDAYTEAHRFHMRGLTFVVCKVSP